MRSHKIKLVYKNKTKARQLWIESRVFGTRAFSIWLRRQSLRHPKTPIDGSLDRRGRGRGPQKSFGSLPGFKVRSDLDQEQRARIGRVSLCRPVGLGGRRRRASAPFTVGGEAAGAEAPVTICPERGPLLPKGPLRLRNVSIQQVLPVVDRLNSLWPEIILFRCKKKIEDLIPGWGG